jgi:hypothetical protein
MNAVWDAQAWFISNAGDEGSIVLIALRKGAMTGKDRRLGHFEWSAPDGCDIEDPAAWAAANPNLGYRIDVDSIAGAAALAKQNGGAEEAGYRTEVLCMHVRALDAAVDPSAWQNSTIDGTLDEYRSRIVLCLDIAPDGQHATLAAAAVTRPGVTRVEIVAAWSGLGCTQQLRADLPGWIARVKPRALAWFPNGPAAALAADLGKVKRPGWPPRGVKVEEIRQDMAAVCMGFAEQVRAGGVEHSTDPLLDAHVLDTEKLRRGDTYVFSRKGKGHCDGAYAAAGAVHLARTLPRRPSTHVPMSTEVANELARRRGDREGQQVTP